MNVNQYPFEVVRDIATRIIALPPGESLAISVTRDEGVSDGLYSWVSSKGENPGSADLAEKPRKAYLE